MIGLLRWSALECAVAKYSRELLEDLTFKGVQSELRDMFNLSNYVDNVASRLGSLKQGHRTVTDYSVKLRVLATESDWSVNYYCLFKMGLCLGV